MRYIEAVGRRKIGKSGGRGWFKKETEAETP